MAHAYEPSCCLNHISAAVVEQSLFKLAALKLVQFCCLFRLFTNFYYRCSSAPRLVCNKMTLMNFDICPVKILIKNRGSLPLWMWLMLKILLDSRGIWTVMETLSYRDTQCGQSDILHLRFWCGWPGSLQSFTRCRDDLSSWMSTRVSSGHRERLSGSQTQATNLLHTHCTHDHES